MNILLLAPHPFYQERGTPIAVDLLLRAFAQRGDRVDLVTFHEGDNVTYQGITIHRIRNLTWIRNIRPGFSWKKIICDLFLLVTALRLARRGKYQIVHAVEESVFIAWLIRLLCRIPYVFDMDSSMPEQLVEQKPVLAVIAPFLKFFEAQVTRRAFVVIAVCEALAEIARQSGARRVFVLHDISLVAPALAFSAAVAEPPLNVEKPCLMYIGNLEKYQGLDLLLESFAMVIHSMPEAFLAVIGGHKSSIAHYEMKASALGIVGRVRFFGPRPLSGMAQLFSQADILVSPRVQGTNTPMKIYSYLASGKPIVATALPTHTQVLDPSLALLAKPNPEEFAAAILSLLRNPGLGRQLAARAATLAEERYSFKSFTAMFNDIYTQIEHDLHPVL